jgi:predicted FMN-binding regulatory protein PaiB
MTNPYRPRELSDVAKLVEAYPLCWVVAGRPDSGVAAPLPLLAETDRNGRVESLLGHMSRVNPLRSALENEPRATILCMGPQG